MRKTKRLPTFLTYFKKKGQFSKRLSKNEEFRLFRAWKNEGDKKALDKLVRANLNFVICCANKYRPQCNGKAITIEDLIQAGNEGLIQAIHHFKTSKKVRLGTFAFHWIRSCIQKYILKNTSLVHIDINNITRDLFNQKWTINDASHNRDPDFLRQWEEEISKKYGVSSSFLKKEEQKFHTIINQHSLDRKIRSDGDDGTNSTMYDITASEQFDAVRFLEDKSDQNLMKQKAKLALEQLSPREKEIIGWRYLDEENKTMTQVGERLNISRQRVHEIERRAIKKMKEKLLEEPGMREVFQ